MNLHLFGVMQFALDMLDGDVVWSGEAFPSSSQLIVETHIRGRKSYTHDNKVDT